MKHAIRSEALRVGFDDCRFAGAGPAARGAFIQDWVAQGCHGTMDYLRRTLDRRLDPSRVLPGAATVVTLAMSYATPDDARRAAARENSGPQVTPHAAARRGVVARYARYPDYHDLLAPPLRSLTAFIDHTGGAGTRSLWYTDTGPVLERELAERAGLGFVGKHTNLIPRGLGNWVFLAEILTTLPLDPDPPERNRCGRCTRCIAACPTAAIVAPFQLDARRCISYLTIEHKGPIPVPFRPLIGNRVFGCDDCLAVCPWNRFAKAGRLLRDHSRPEMADVDLVSVLAIDDAEFRRRFADSPLARVKRRGLLRNVCVALGNVGTPDALPALARAATDPEPLIAEHAHWAMTQITRRVTS
jgi:epoxyqueuosine reductase